MHRRALSGENCKFLRTTARASAVISQCTAMADLIITVGFQSIFYDNNRPNSSKKGRLLAESGHVLNLQEKYFAGICKSVITANVIRQTSVSLKPYHVTIEVT